MKRPDLAQSIQILANVGILAGIVFLVVEVRQNNELLALQAESDGNAVRNSLVELVLANPDLIELMTKDESTLTPLERDRLVMLGLRLHLNYEDTYRDVMRGLRDPEDAIRVTRSVYWRDRLNYGSRFAWETYKERADPGYVAWMEENVIGPGPPP